MTIYPVLIIHSNSSLCLQWKEWLREESIFSIILHSADEAMAQISGKQSSIVVVDHSLFTDAFTSVVGEINLKDSISLLLAATSIPEAISTLQGIEFSGYIQESVERYQFIHSIKTALRELRLKEQLNQYDLKLKQLNIDNDALKQKLDSDNKQNSLYYQTLVESVNDWIWEVNTDGIYTYSNPRVRDILGYEPEDVVGTSAFSFMPPDEKAILAEKFISLIQNENPIECLVNTCLHKDGHEVIRETNGNPFFSENGKLLGYRGIDRDITNRGEIDNVLREKNIELRKSQKILLETDEALRKSEKFFVGTLNDMITFVAVLELNGEVIFVNNTPLKIAGLTEKDVVGKKFYDTYWWTYSNEISNTIKEDIKKCARGETIFRDIIIRIKDDSRLSIEYSMHPIYSDDREIIYLTAEGRDITERIHAQQEKDKMQDMLLQSQKMEAIGTLAGGIAHDFNNLLTAIKGAVEMSMIKIDKANTIYKYLEQIDHASQKAAALTKQMLLFGRQDTPEYSIVNINDIAKNMLDMLERIIGEDIRINTCLNSTWSTSADPNKLEQVILNMVVNAHDAMPDGGTIDIKTEDKYIDKIYSQIIPEAKDGNYVCIVFSDSGTGMEDGVIEQIFNPFYTTKEAGKGTGLGLSVVYGIILQHGGWINVYSELGIGTQFKIYLPAIEGEAKEETFEIQHPENFQGNREKILLIEDQEEVRHISAEYLTDNGYEVFAAEDGKKAAELFAEHNGDFNLIFSDVVLPDISGLDLVNEFIAQKPNLNVIICSGYTEKKAKLTTIKESGFTFIEKPYSFVNLLSLIKEKLNQNA